MNGRKLTVRFAIATRDSGHQLMVEAKIRFDPVRTNGDEVIRCAKSHMLSLTFNASANRLARWREMNVWVGTAGWGIAQNAADQFPAEGSSLGRYAGRFAAVEINSSFHRSHLEKTWARWRDEVPASFRFSVKMPKEISHQRKLVECDDALAVFARQVRHLGEKLGVLLLQLPPKLEFEPAPAEAFLARLSSLALANLACEPRHRSWFSDRATQLLTHYKVAQVGADPDVTGYGASPGGWSGIEYRRLHGSPHIDRVTPTALRQLRRR